ncbi:hypothetical protein FOCC_FOCC005211 [Frankliniella occidentalis]|nr:hypothetical protein FOCC_FOCC005211 [Frankliniella occidentalis]
MSNSLAEGVCTLQMTVRPPRASILSSWMHCEEDRSSSPVVGSSRKMTGGLLTSSWAMDSRLRSPPDSFEVWVSRALVSRSMSRISSICVEKEMENSELGTVKLRIRFRTGGALTAVRFWALLSVFPSLRSAAIVMDSSTWIVTQPQREKETSADGKVVGGEWRDPPRCAAEWGFCMRLERMLRVGAAKRINAEIARQYGFSVAKQCFVGWQPELYEVVASQMTKLNPSYFAKDSYESTNSRIRWLTWDRNNQH